MEYRPRNTKAAILVQQNTPLIYDEIELPEQLEIGQVLVKMIRSGICGSQLGEIDGVKGPDRFLPHLMGHEGFAKVLDVGEGVRHIQKDDYVVLHWRQGKGIQSEPPKYKWLGKDLNAGWVTTFNEHAVVSENRCTRVSKETNPDHAALYGCAITTGMGVVENNAKLKMGESVVVYGAGGIGLNIIQGASLKSAWPIIAVDKFESRLQLAKKMGAHHCINTSKVDAKAAIELSLSKHGLDVFIDNTGVPEVIELGYSLTRSGGRVILVGVPKKGSNISLNSLPLHFGKQLIGSHGGESMPSVDIPRYLRIEQQGILKLDNLISKHYSLEEINDAIGAMRNGETAGRIIIRF